ncbi:hypothetical protein RCL1_007496 [Eukaryota sp. TZLM3-RCL]
MKREMTFSYLLEDLMSDSPFSAAGRRTARPSPYPYPLDLSEPVFETVTPSLLFILITLIIAVLPVARLINFSVPFLPWVTLLFATSTFFFMRLFLSQSVVFPVGQQQRPSFLIFVLLSVILSTILVLAINRILSPMFYHTFHPTSLTTRDDVAVDDVALMTSSFDDVYADINALKDTITGISLEFSNFRSEYSTTSVLKLSESILEIQRKFENIENGFKNSFKNLEHKETDLQSKFENLKLDLQQLSSNLREQSNLIEKEDEKIENRGVEITKLEEKIENLKQNLDTEISQQFSILESKLSQILAQISNIPQTSLDSIAQKEAQKLLITSSFPNVLAPTSFVSIVKSKTTNSLQPSIIDKFLALIFGDSLVESVLSPDLSPGKCWPFKGEKAQIVFKFKKPLTFVEIGLDHVSRSEYLIDFSSAPRNFTVYCDGPEQKNLKILTSFFDIDQSNSQTFPLSSGYDCQILRFNFESNYGGEYTCIYRLRAHVLV